MQDLALAAGVLALGQADVWYPVLTEPSLPGPEGGLAASYAVMAGSLAFRRRAPFAVLAIVAAITVGWSVAFGATEGPGSLTPLLVATYSVARHGTRREAVGALVIIALVVVVHEAFNPDNRSWRDLANALAWDTTMLGAWLAGSWIRARRLYEESLTEAAERAESERVARELRAAERAAELQRVTIAHELHDVVAHGVSMMVLQAGAAEVQLAKDPAGTAERLRRIDGIGRDALTELRRLLSVLKTGDDAALTPLPGIGSIEDLADSMRAAGLVVRVCHAGTAVELPPGVDLTAYRVVQESLTNAARHAGGRNVTVALRWSATDLEIEIVDDGQGRLPVSAGQDGAGQEGAGQDGAGQDGAGRDGHGHGLDGMRARVELCGGVLAVGNHDPHGFRVHARLPLQAAS